MYSIIESAYISGRYTEANIDLFVRVGYLTEAQAIEIKESIVA